MQDLEMKQNVLKEIMELMDQKEGESLKSHPKFMKKTETQVGEPQAESSDMEMSEESPETEAIEDSEGEITAEQLEMLLAKLQAAQ